MKTFTAETQRTPRLRGGVSLRSLGVLCVSAVLSLCSCAMSANRGAQSQQQQSQAPGEQTVTQAKPAAPKKSTVADPNKFALIVAGVGGEDAYKKKFTAQALRMREVL